MEYITTSNFVTEMNKLGYEVEKTSHKLYVIRLGEHNEHDTIATVHREHMREIDTMDYSFNMDLDAYELLLRYSKTPASERKDDESDLEDSLIKKQNHIDGLENEIRGLKKQIAEQDKILNDLGERLLEYHRNQVLK